MKAFLLSIIMVLFYHTSLAQVCQEINLFDNREKRELIRDYISNCYQNHHFFEDKGVVTVTVYQDPAGHTCWRLSALIDNRFFTLPPKQYAWNGNNVTLIYQGDSTGKPIIFTSGQDKASLINCMAELVGSRVYNYVSSPQYAYDIDNKGNKKKILIKHDTGGNIHNELIIIFNNDGTFTKKIPA